MRYGASAAVVTTKGDTVVAKFFARNGPSGWDSQAWMSRADQSFSRQKPNTYASIAVGSSSTALRDAGLNSTAVVTAGMTQTTLANLIQTTLAAGKPIIAVKTGRSRASQQAAKSHTGAIAGDYAAFLADVKFQAVPTRNVLLFTPMPHSVTLSVWKVVRLALPF